jgi:hypothetical protein
MEHLEFNVGLSDGKKLDSAIMQKVRKCYNKAVDKTD